MSAPLRFPLVQSPNSDGSFLRGLSYTAGFADGLGPRRLAADATGAVLYEVLGVNPAFADVPGFERTLRARVEQAGRVNHVSLSTVQSVERLEGPGLAVIARYTAGRRVSELAATEHGPVFALDLIRAVMPALSVLHQAGLAHGTLSADRIVVTREGRFVVVDHALGTAIHTLDLPPAPLHGLGLVVPEGGKLACDGPADMRQLGFLALSLLLRRPLDPADWPSKIPALLDELVDVVERPALSTRMRMWLERAMQMDPRSFASATDALDAADQLPSDVDMQRAESARAMLAFPSEAAPPLEPEVTPAPVDPPKVEPAVQPVMPVAAVKPAAQVEKAGARGFSRWAAWIIGGLALLAAGEAAAVLFLTYGRPAASLIEIRSPETQLAPAPVLPAVPTPTPTARPGGSDSVPPAERSGTPKTEAPAPSASPSSAAAGPHIGGLKVSSAVDLQVFKDGTLLGSTAGPIAVNEGAHSLEFVNDTLAFRFRQLVNVKNGQMTAVTIPVPSSRLNINAVPWAEVTIDGVAAGETPIANLALPIGTHEIVFRHPQLGERKQTVVVKVGPLLRVSQSFQQAFKY